MPDYTRAPSPCARREYFEKQLKTSIRRGGHYSSAIGSKGSSGGGLAEHDWIYVGRGYVVEIPGSGYPVTKSEMDPSGYVTERVSPSELALNSAINAKDQGWNYDAAYNNCQHFAYWCSKGLFESRNINYRPLNPPPVNDVNEYRANPPGHFPGVFKARFSEQPKGKKMYRPNPF